MIKLNMPLQQYATATTTIRLPHSTSEQDVELTMLALGEFEHAKAINNFRNFESAQAMDLLLALLTGIPNHANMPLLGYGWKCYGSRVASKNRVPRTDALLKCDLASREKLANLQQIMQFTVNDTLEDALEKIELYRVNNTAQFDNLNAGLGDAIKAFRNIYK